jgi:uncharacterized protein YdaL
MSNEEKNSFEEASKVKQGSIVAEFYHFLKHNKKFWLIPILIVLLLMGLVIILGGTAAAPFIYTLF